MANTQTAFLYVHLEEELPLKDPEGYQEYLGEEKFVNNYLYLNKLIYGVQAAIVFSKKFAKVLC
jgi:hypothetical protein